MLLGRRYNVLSCVLLFVDRSPTRLRLEGFLFKLFNYDCNGCAYQTAHPAPSGTGFESPAAQAQVHQAQLLGTSFSTQFLSSVAQLSFSPQFLSSVSKLSFSDQFLGSVFLLSFISSVSQLSFAAQVIGSTSLFVNR